jgi:hypothetical protein
MRTFFVLASIAILMFCQLSCAPDEEQTQIENPVTGETITQFNAAPLLGDVVLKNMYEAEARTLTDKTPVQIVTVLEGTNRVVLQARFRGIRDVGFGFPLYECELMDESAEALGGIAKGMSGSPVGPPGRIMGALAYGDPFSTAPTRFWVTAIDAMEATLDHQTFGELLAQAPIPAAPGIAVNTTYAPVKTPVMITGIQSHRIQELASHLSDSQHNFVELFADISSTPAAPPAGASRTLTPGDMIGVAVVTGDIVNTIGFGTVTQVYDGKFVAFGHPMFGDGKSALPVYRAVVNGIVPNLQASYKSASAYGSPIGTVTKDLNPGIVGELGAPPSMIPIKLSYRPANSATTIEKHHRVAYGQESHIALVAATTLEALRMEASSGTVDGTVTLDFQETKTVYVQTFREASPDVFPDVLRNIAQIVNAFTDMLANSAGKATLKSVSISITDKPQIAKAEIAEVIVPEEISPGERVSVSIVLVPHWSTVGGERTIQREVTLEVPEDFPAGEATINVSASASDFDFGGFGEPEEEPPIPKTLNEHIKQLEDVQVDPGLITVTLSSSGFDGGGPGFPSGLLPPESTLPLGDRNRDDAGEVPEDLLELDNLLLPEDIGPPPIVEAELIIDGFIVTGSKDVTVRIKGEEMGRVMVPIEAEVPIEPMEPIEE